MGISDGIFTLQTEGRKGAITDQNTCPPFWEKLIPRDDDAEDWMVERHFQGRSVGALTFGIRQWEKIPEVVKCYVIWWYYELPPENSFPWSDSKG